MKKIKGILITGLLLLSMFILVSPVSAQTIVVNPGDDLKDILENAPDGSTIHIREGVYGVGGMIDTMLGAALTGALMLGVWSRGYDRHWKKESHNNGRWPNKDNY